MKLGWQTKKIGDVCHLMTGGTPSKAKPEYFGGEIRWLVSGDIHQGEIFDCEGRITETGMRNSNAKLLPVNSVMIALNGQGKTRGTVALLRTRATCNQSLVSIYPNEPDKLLPEFLYANLHGRYQEIRQMTGDSGNDRRGLNMGLIESIEIPIAPLPEQQRIVGILDEAFEDIATAKCNAEKNLQNARALFESHLQSVFTQRGPGWVEKRLGDVSSIARGGSPRPIKKFLTTATNGINWIKIGDATTSGKYIYKTEEKIIPEGAKRSRTVHDGDFLLSNSMSFGRPYIMRTSGCIHDGWLVLTDYASRLDQDYLYYLLGSQFVYQQFDRLAAGSTVRNLNIELASRVEIPVPPLNSQKEIAKQFEALSTDIQRLATLYERKLAALEELNKSLLHQAFTGRL
jgi:type I restriction enzyme S subunit